MALGGRFTDYAKYVVSGWLQGRIGFFQVDKPQVRKEVDTTNGDVIYIGESQLNASVSDSTWKIKRITISGSLITTEWADGDTLYDNTWDDRVSLSYS